MGAHMFMVPLQSFSFFNRGFGPVRLIDFSADNSRRIELFESVSASSVDLADGSGESHSYALYFEPGGTIGKHEAGFDQLFLVVDGEGWVSDSNDNRLQLQKGQGAFFEKGEIHSKGSNSGMTVIMVQCEKYSLR